MGSLPGVQCSAIGHQDGREIVQVQYDPKQVKVKTMVGALKQYSSFHHLIVKNDQEKKQAQSYLSNSQIITSSSKPHLIKSKHSLRTRYPKLYYLDLSEKQAMLLNRWSYFGGSMPKVLTKEQKKLYAHIKKASTLPTHLTPKRTEKGRKKYRQALLKWLKKNL